MLHIREVFVKSELLFGRCGFIRSKTEKVKENDGAWGSISGGLSPKLLLGIHGLGKERRNPKRKTAPI